ncbi:MAG: DUF3795 domain-containing protein [Anaerolineae bacterium]
MDTWSDINTVAYCGLVCAGCSALVHGCAGCRSGGGTEGCLVRSCSRRRGFSGCWECTEKQCDVGVLADPDSGGPIRAFQSVARELTPAGLLARVQARLDQLGDLAALQGQSKAQVLILLGEGDGSTACT